MPRPKSPFPKIKLHIALPQETVARLRVIFASPDHANGLKHGAVSLFVDQAINEKFERMIRRKPDDISSIAIQ